MDHKIDLLKLRVEEDRAFAKNLLDELRPQIDLMEKEGRDAFAQLEREAEALNLGTTEVTHRHWRKAVRQLEELKKTVQVAGGSSPPLKLS